MSEKLTGQSGTSTVVLTRERTTDKYETYNGGERSVPAVKSVLTVDLDSNGSADVTIKAVFNEEMRGYANLEYKGKIVGDMMNPNLAVASRLTSAGVTHDNSGRLDPEDTLALVQLAQSIARAAELESPTRR